MLKTTPSNLLVSIIHPLKGIEHLQAYSIRQRACSSKLQPFHQKPSNLNPLFIHRRASCYCEGLPAARLTSASHSSTPHGQWMAVGWSLSAPFSQPLSNANSLPEQRMEPLFSASILLYSSGLSWGGVLPMGGVVLLPTDGGPGAEP